MECIFCKIIERKILAKIRFESDHILVFDDLYPKAKTHVLVVPKKHIESLCHQGPEDAVYLLEITQSLPKIALHCGLLEGFKTVINTGKAGGQEVFHLHYHLLGGAPLSKVLKV